MPTPLAHTFCGFIFYHDTEAHLFQNRIYAASFTIFFSTLPDYDYLIGLVKGDLMWGHRIFTHTLIFPFLIGLIIGIIAKLCQRKFLPFFTLTALLVGVHIMLDYFSFDYNPENGIGVPLVWPLSSNFYNSPFHPLATQYMGDSPSLLSVLLNDLYYMAIFGGLIIWRRRYREKMKKERSNVCASEL